MPLVDYRPRTKPAERLAARKAERVDKTAPVVPTKTEVLASMAPIENLLRAREVIEVVGSASAPPTSPPPSSPTPSPQLDKFTAVIPPEESEVQPTPRPEHEPAIGERAYGVVERLPMVGGALRFGGEIAGIDPRVKAVKEASEQPELRDRAKGILADEGARAALKDAGLHGSAPRILDKLRQMRQNQGKSEQEAYDSALTDLTTLKTVGLWTGPLPYHLFTTGPRKSILAAMAPTTEVLGFDRSSNLVIRQETPTGYIFDILSAPEIALAATGGLEKTATFAFGKSEIRPPKTQSAAERISERQDAMEAMSKTALADKHPVLAGLIGLGASVAIPDPATLVGLARLGLGKIGRMIEAAQDTGDVARIHRALDKAETALQADQGAAKVVLEAQEVPTEPRSPERPLAVVSAPEAVPRVRPEPPPSTEAPLPVLRVQLEAARDVVRKDIEAKKKELAKGVIPVVRKHLEESIAWSERRAKLIEDELSKVAKPAPSVVVTSESVTAPVASVASERATLEEARAEVKLALDEAKTAMVSAKSTKAKAAAAETIKKLQKRLGGFDERLAMTIEIPSAAEIARTASLRETAMAATAEIKGRVTTAASEAKTFAERRVALVEAIKTTKAHIETGKIAETAARASVRELARLMTVRDRMAKKLEASRVRFHDTVVADSEARSTKTAKNMVEAKRKENEVEKSWKEAEKAIQDHVVADVEKLGAQLNAARQLRDGLTAKLAEVEKGLGAVTDPVRIKARGVAIRRLRSVITGLDRRMMTLSGAAEEALRHAPTPRGEAPPSPPPAPLGRVETEGRFPSLGVIEVSPRDVRQVMRDTAEAARNFSPELEAQLEKRTAMVFLRLLQPIPTKGKLPLGVAEEKQIQEETYKIVNRLFVHDAEAIGVPRSVRSADEVLRIFDEEGPKLLPTGASLPQGAMRARLQDALLDARSEAIWSLRTQLGIEDMPHPDRTALLDLVRPARVGSVVKAVKAVFDLLSAPILGMNELADLQRAILDKDLQHATIEAQAALQAVYGDVGKIKTYEHLIDYLEGKPVWRYAPQGFRAGIVGGPGKGRSLLTSGIGRYRSWKMALRAGLIDKDRQLTIAKTFVSPDIEPKLTQAQIDSLMTVMADASKSKTADDFFITMQEETRKILEGIEGAILPLVDGLRRSAAVMASDGLMFHITEKWMGQGLLLSNKQAQAVIDFLAGDFAEAASIRERIPAAVERGDVLAAMERLHRTNNEAKRISTRKMRIENELSGALRKIGVGEAEIPELLGHLTTGAAAAVARTKAVEAVEEATRLSQRFNLEELRRDLERPLERHAIPATTRELALRAVHEKGEIPEGAVVRESLSTLGFTSDEVERITGLQSALDSGLYLPEAARLRVRKLLDSVSNMRPGEAKTGIGDVLRAALNFWSSAVTRGYVVTNPAHFLNNVYGDFEQMVITKKVGWQAAFATSVRSDLQAMLAMPIVGQVLALGGQAERVRRGLQVGGERLTKLLNLSSVRLEVNKLLDVSEADHATIKLGHWKGTYGQLRETGKLGRVFDNFDDTLLHRQIVHTAVEDGVVGRLYHWARQMGSTTVGKVWNRAFRDSISDISQNIALRKRSGLFLTLIEHGMQPEEAAKVTREALFDYRYGLSEFESQTLRWIFPFWAFQKSANRLTFNALLDPVTAYRMHVFRTGTHGAATLMSAGLNDSDAYGFRPQQMASKDLVAYEQVVRYLTDRGLTPGEIRGLLRADIFDENNGKLWWKNWPDLPADFPKNDEWEFISYQIPEYGPQDFPGYYKERGMIRLPVQLSKEILQNPDADIAQYMAVLLPPETTLSAFNHAGAVLGAYATFLQMPFEPVPVHLLAQSVEPILNPARMPLSGPAINELLSYRAPPTIVSKTLGPILAAVGLATPTDRVVRGPGDEETQYRLGPGVATLMQMSRIGSFDTLFRRLEKLDSIPQDRAIELLLGAANFAMGATTTRAQPGRIPIYESYRTRAAEESVLEDVAYATPGHVLPPVVYPNQEQ